MSADSRPALPPAPVPASDLSDEERLLLADTARLLARYGKTLETVVLDPFEPDEEFDIETVFEPVDDERGALTRVPLGLPSIGPATVTLLEQCGVATAYDVLNLVRVHRDDAPSRLNGVGPARWAVLLKWAKQQKPDLARLAAATFAERLHYCACNVEILVLVESAEPFKAWFRRARQIALHMDLERTPNREGIKRLSRRLGIQRPLDILQKADLTDARIREAEKARWTEEAAGRRAHRTRLALALALVAGLATWVWSTHRSRVAQSVSANGVDAATPLVLTAP